MSVHASHAWGLGWRGGAGWGGGGRGGLGPLPGNMGWWVLPKDTTWKVEPTRSPRRHSCRVRFAASIFHPAHRHAHAHAYIRVPTPRSVASQPGAQTQSLRCIRALTCHGPRAGARVVMGRKGEPSTWCAKEGDGMEGGGGGRRGAEGGGGRWRRCDGVPGRGQGWGLSRSDQTRAPSPPRTDQ
jgi:hypothetical protein